MPKKKKVKLNINNLKQNKQMNYITLTLKWTGIIIGYLLLFFIGLPIMISAPNDITPLLGVFLIPVSIVILIILIIKQVKSIKIKLKLN